MSKGITRARVVEAALEVLDRSGADGVTVRAVADRLGVRAPALYWHVRNKQDLLDQMGTEILNRVNAALDSGPFASSLRDELARYATVLRAEYLAHRDGARTFSGTRLVDPEALRSREPMLRHWVGLGADLDTVIQCVELVTAFVVGFVIEEQERAQSEPERYDLARRNDALGEGAPLVRRAGVIQARSADERFQWQLRVLLDGVTQQLAGPETRRV